MKSYTVFSNQTKYSYQKDKRKKSLNILKLIRQFIIHDSERGVARKVFKHELNENDNFKFIVNFCSSAKAVL